VSFDYLNFDNTEDLAMEDIWYEIEGAYEVYGIGRCRFVLVHCCIALNIGLYLLAKNKCVPWPEEDVNDLGKELGMPEHFQASIEEIDRAGKYLSIMKMRSNDQEYAASILSKTLETFDWIRGEIGKE
jgi:hypothetical protein